jgi:hypothetical protein
MWAGSTEPAHFVEEGWCVFVKLVGFLLACGTIDVITRRKLLCFYFDLSMLPLVSLRCLASLCGHRLLFSAFAAGLFLSPLSSHAIVPASRPPSNEEQYTLQLINHARANADGLSILQGLVTNNVQTITPSTTGVSSNGTPWSQGFWTSSIPGIADSMNYFRVHPGDLKRQFLDLAPLAPPLAWNANLGNVAAGYNDLVIASQGVTPGFPHSLAPYQDQNTFATYAQRYLDGGYGSLTTINYLGENIAPNGFSSALATFAAFMIDWGNTWNGIQSQDPNYGSHRLSIVAGHFTEIGISRKPGWNPGAVTEVQEFGRRFAVPPAIVGAVYVDQDRNGFYTPGEGLGQMTVTATPVGGGSAFQTGTYGSGGYTLEVSTPGTYAITFTGDAGVVHSTTVTIQSQHILLDVAVAQNTVAPQHRQASDMNGDNTPDYVLFHPAIQYTATWYLNGGTAIGGANGPTISAGWVVAGVADFNADTHSDYLLYHPASRSTAVWYLHGSAVIGSAAGPTLSRGWTLADLADFNRDGQVDYLIYHKSTRQTMVWYLSGGTIIAAANGPVIPTGAAISGVADFNLDGRPDILLYNARKRQTTICYLDGAAKIGEASSFVAPKGWVVAGVADFNLDSYPDILLCNSGDGRTEIRYLNGVAEIASASAPTLPPGWNLVSP